MTVRRRCSISSSAARSSATCACRPPKACWRRARTNSSPSSCCCSRIRDARSATTADETLNRIPVEALQAFLARPDVPVDLREFFADRGIFPDRNAR